MTGAAAEYLLHEMGLTVADAPHGSHQEEAQEQESASGPTLLQGCRAEDPHQTPQETQLGQPQVSVRSVSWR